MLRDSWPALVLLLVVLGVALDQQALLVMGALYAASMGVARVWNRWALRAVTYSRSLDEERAFVGETVTLTVEVANRKPLPLSWIRVEDRMPETLTPEGRALLPSAVPGMGLLANVAALSWHEKVRWRYSIPCTERGFFFFGPVVLHSGDIFGIFESEATLGARTRLIVYPQVQPLAQLGLPAKEPFGPRRARPPAFEDPVRVVGTREYHPDDPMRRVHWKATARTQTLQVRVWEPSQAQQLVVLLNVATFERHWEGVNRALLEWLISVAASICLHAFEEKTSIGLVANASVPASDQRVRVAPGRSPHQLRTILEALAAVTPFATGPFDRLLREESTKLAWGATLVVVSAIVNEALQAQMLRLQRAGRLLALVSLDNSFTADDGAALQAHGLLVHRLPHTLDHRSADPTPDLPLEVDPDTAFKRPGASRGV